MLSAGNVTASTADIHLQWLFGLRCIAIAGQITAVTVWGLGLPLPLGPLWAIIGSLAAVNLLTWLRLRSAKVVSNAEFFLQLTMDVLALTALLYLTGGATNPFAWLFLLPLIIAAGTLPKAHTWAMAVLTTLCYSGLMVAYVPFPYPKLAHDSGFGLHVVGMWIGFVLCAGLVAYFVVGMADALRRRDRSLARAREQALRDERVVALGTLAAGAAHELGTPLSTVSMLAAELEEDYSGARFGDLHAKLGVLSAQVKRCRQALSVISASAGEPRLEGGCGVLVDDYLEQLVNEWHQARPGVDLRYRFRGDGSAPWILAERTLSQAILNILDNAADASPQFVELKGTWDHERLVIEVGDQGDGINAELGAHNGQRPFTTKPGGLGLGLFLAHAAIGRFGGQVTLTNRSEGGALTRVTLPLPVPAPAAVP
jgi:two-component system sensor histidine kinase RegB